MAHAATDIPDTLRRAHLHHRAGEFQQAEALYRAVLTVDPEHADANHLLGLLAFQAGDLQTAAAHIARAILRDGNQALYLNNLGLVLQAQQQPDQALMLFEQAAALDPSNADARFNCGIVLDALGHCDAALASFDAVLARNPQHAAAHNGRGLVLHALGRFAEALAAFDRALGLDPGFAEAHNNRGNSLQAQGRIQEACAAYRQALALRGDFAGAHSNLLLCLNYDADSDAAAIFAAHRDWALLHAAPLAPMAAAATTRDPGRRLRIGYVSPDFNQHPVAAFIEPLLAMHDRQGFEVVCYSNSVRSDAVTQRLRQLAAGWRVIHGMADAVAAALIRRDGIDILVDLAGHTAGQRLQMYALRPAPVQLTYLGYPGTSGLDAMDYRLTDAWLDPPGLADALHTETLLRVPGGSHCFAPPRSSPAVTALPALRPGQVTFASFNNIAKISPATVALWSQVLAALPDSRLRLKARSSGDAATVARLTGLFAQHGIGAGRLEFRSWLAAGGDHLAAYGDVHIALDTMPYSGCTTTCEALWMGVPVITLEQAGTRSRLSQAVLREAGLDLLVAATPADYVALTCALATDMERLNNLRMGLRGQLAQSALLDAGGRTRAIEAVYRDIWQRYCAGSARG